MVAINDLVKNFNGRPFLKIPSLQFERGVKYAILGANGSGKSTLLRILAGFMRPDEGSADISPELRANRGYMPQRPYIFGFSVLKNVTIALPDQEYARKDAAEALKKLGMEALMNARGGRLSGGEAQRTAIAAMIAQPRMLLLLDEPTSATDIAGNDLVENALSEYAKKTGCLLIFSTHSPAQAERLADMAIFMHDGEVIENGPVDQVLHRPGSELSASFLRHWELKK